MGKVMLEVRNLKTKYVTRFHEDVYAVDGVSFKIEEGKSLGIAGESGCGKSTLALSMMGYYFPPLHYMSGDIVIDGRNISGMKPDDVRKSILGTEIAYIPQAAMNALNPTQRIIRFIEDVVRAHDPKKDKKLIRELAEARFAELGLPPEVLDKHAVELSGGMKQRVVIAIALACSPKLLIADEPTTALDVTIQAQVLELMKDLINNRDMSMLMITHSLGIVAEVCDDMAVMYAGRIVEKGTVDDVFNNMRHPYTEGLFNSLPNLKEQGEMLEPIKGLMPDPADLPPGCTFAPRCPYATEACSASVPELHSVDGSKTHFVACHAYSRPGFALRRNQK